MTRRAIDIAHVAQRSSVALLMIDVVNDLDFPGNSEVLRDAPRMARRLSQLKKRAKEHGVACVYVNDNFGLWRSDFAAIVEQCQKTKAGRRVVDSVPPQKDDYFVLKPTHSGFYSTCLDVLLKYIGARKLIVTGISTNICVMFTAIDAYMRGFELFVPSDCVISNSRQSSKYALVQMQETLKAWVGNSRNLPWTEWKMRTSKRRPSKASR